MGEALTAADMHAAASETAFRNAMSDVEQQSRVAPRFESADSDEKIARAVKLRIRQIHARTRRQLKWSPSGSGEIGRLNRNAVAIMAFPRPGRVT